MKLSVIYQPTVPASTSPYRVCEEKGGEVEWANAFLDGQRLRQLSLRSLRIYSYDLLNFARWFAPRHQPLAEITESTLVDYVRHQLEQDPKPTPRTVNHRLGTVRCCYRFHTGQEIPAGQAHFQHRYTRKSPLGYGRPRTAIARRLRLRQDRRVIVPLSAEEVGKFWQSFRTYRDLVLVGLMLLDGLRSGEVLALELENVQLADGQIRVHGKGNKERFLGVAVNLMRQLCLASFTDRYPKVNPIKQLQASIIGFHLSLHFLSEDCRPVRCDRALKRRDSVLRETVIGALYRGNEIAFVLRVRATCINKSKN